MRAIRLYLCALAALVLVLGVGSVTLARASAPTTADAVTYYGHFYPSVSRDLVWSMIDRESAGDPKAYNASGATGILQYLPGTWGYACQMEMNDMTYAPGLAAVRRFDPVDCSNIWSVWDQVHLTFYLLYRGYGCWWTSYQDLTGAC